MKKEEFPQKQEDSQEIVNRFLLQYKKDISDLIEWINNKLVENEENEQRNYYKKEKARYLLDLISDYEQDTEEEIEKYMKITNEEERKKTLLLVIPMIEKSTKRMTGEWKEEMIPKF